MKRIGKSSISPKSMNNSAILLPHKFARYFIAFALALICSPAIFGQATGSFSGTIADKSGSGVVGATVTATSLQTGLTREGKADTAGHYLIPLLPVGIYTIRVDASGFQSVESKDLKLQVDEARELDFSLVPATVVTTVQVAGDAVAVETANPSLGQVITSQQVSQLPLNGRDFVQLATLTAGATTESNPGSFFTAGSDSEVAARGSFSLSVGGSRPNSTDWLLDGVDNNELTAGGIGIFSSIDDIQEFKVLTYTYSAEFGTRAGPTVLVTTKSGTNNIHGTLFEFVRNTDLDAKSYFANSVEKFNLNQFGGAVGGPFRKNKTFWFVDGEQKDQLHGQTFTGLVPTTAMRNGDFSADNFGNPVSGIVISNPNVSPTATGPNYFQCNGQGIPEPVIPGSGGQQQPGVPCNKIPQALLSSIGTGMMAYYPAPNVNFGAANGSYNYISEPVRSLYETKFDIRVDHTFSSIDNAFARFSYDQAYSYVPGGALPGDCSGVQDGCLAESNAFGSNERIRNHARNIAIGESHIFSAKTLNQFNIGYNRIFDYIASQDNTSCAAAALGIPNADLGCGGGAPGSTTCAGDIYSCGLTSTIVTGGYWALGDRGYSPFQGGTNTFSVKDTLELIRGKHDIKIGLDFRANQMNVGTEAFGDGFWIIGNDGNQSGYNCTPGATGCNNVAGNPEADLALGITGLAIRDQTFQGAVTGRRWKTYRPFVEDNWRPFPSLTLNLGLGWNLTTPVTEEAGRLANYVPSLNQILVANQNGVNASAGVTMDWKAVEPRIGATWKIFGSEKTVLRLGYAMFHDGAWSQGANGLWQNPPFLAESDNFAPTPLADSFQKFTTAPTLDTFSGSLYYQPTDFKLGRMRQLNANIERELPGGVVLTAGYAGSVGSHILVIGNDLNVTSPAACGVVPGYTIGCLPGGGVYTPSFSPPQGNAVFLFGDVGKTHYNSLQVKAETKTARHGLYALVAYTYAKTYDNGLSDGLGSLLSAPYFPLPNWEKLDWSLSQINLDSNFTASVIYDLPFGRGKAFGNNWSNLTNSLVGNWQLTVIEHISSGFPVPLIDSSNQAGAAGITPRCGGFPACASFQNGGNGNNYNRPDQLANCDPYNASHGQLQWINAGCFAAPALGELGNASRVPVVGPDFVNTDFSVIKNFALPFREGMGLNFRAEFFNLFNHAQFGSPVADINASGFGSVNSTVNNPRLVQLAMKLTF
jgi:hypothetical protein